MQPLFTLSDNADKYLSGNALVCSDNIDVLRSLPNACIDLIYIDPPFQSDTHYVAIFGDKGMVDQQLKDIWKWTTETERTFRRLPHGPLLDTLKGIQLQAGSTSSMAAYCVFMGRRLMEMQRVLKDTGSIYVHCDYHASHFLRVLMDAVFGSNSFRNAITWQRTPAHTDSRTFGNVSDTILFYGTGQMNRDAVRVPLKPGYVKSHYSYKDERGVYRADNLTGPGISQGESGQIWNGYDPSTIGRCWSVPLKGKYAQWIGESIVPGYTKVASVLERLDILDNADMLIHASSSKVPQLKRYLAYNLGQVPGDIWSDIPPVNSQAKERVGYPTQKPLALIERIIKASSNPGDLVLDGFCGCGSAVDAAARLGRKYLGIDISAIAVRVMEQRLISRGEAVKPAVYGLEWSEYDWDEFEKRALQSRDDAEDGTPGWAWAEDKVAGLLNAVPNSKKTGDGGVDARYYGAADEVIPIQVKMHQKPVGRPDMDKLLGAQTAMKNRGIHAPMSLMVSLYPPPHNLRTFAAEQGWVTLSEREYPVMQALSVEEMLTKGERPKLPPVDPRALVGNTQTKMVMGE